MNKTPKHIDLERTRRSERMRREAIKSTLATVFAGVSAAAALLQLALQLL